MTRTQMKESVPSLFDIDILSNKSMVEDERNIMLDIENKIERVKKLPIPTRIKTDKLHSLLDHCKNMIDNLTLLLSRQTSNKQELGSRIERLIEEVESYHDTVELEIAERLMTGQTSLKEKDLSHYSYFPIVRPTLEEWAIKQENAYWTDSEIYYDGDREDWDKLSPVDKRFIKFILFFFAQGDGIVIENLIDNFKKETSHYKEAVHAYTIFAHAELTHAKVYSLFIDTLIRDEEEKKRGYNAISYYPSIRKIAEWVGQWMDNKIPLTERIIAFACYEGIIFSSAFAGIYWIKKRNILYGICKANEWIARDEAYHTGFAVALYHYMTSIDPDENTRQELLSQEKVHSILSSCVDVSTIFIKKALLVDLVGINSDDMVAYVKCCADKLSTSLGYDPIYDVENPLDWMKVIALRNKSNFFESQPSEYSRTNGEFVFDLDADF